MEPTVISVSCSKDHLVSKARLESIRLIEGIGVEDDAHAGVTVQHTPRVKRDPSQPNLRQVHLMHAELHDTLREAGFDLTPGEMGENITTRGIDLMSLPAGTLLTLGSEAVIEVTGVRSPCAQLDGLRDGLRSAVLDQDEQGNPIYKSAIMAIVLKGGVVRAGDSIGIELPAQPHVALGRV